MVVMIVSVFCSIIISSFRLVVMRSEADVFIFTGRLKIVLAFAFTAERFDPVVIGNIAAEIEETLPDRAEVARSKTRDGRELPFLFLPLAAPFFSL